MANIKYTPIIGLEIHVELSTRSKMFCGCPAEHFGKRPNTHTCPVCLGLPGALPVPNRLAVDWTVMIGLALNAKIAKQSKFDRKHYNYPDLPKGYQISQYDMPFCVGGKLKTTGGIVEITRIHLEEDTGKLQHRKIDGEDVSLVDFNRSGVPLVEIVTEPDIRSAAQAKEFAQNLQKIIRFLGVSDCDMEKGSMRLEANISLAQGTNHQSPITNLPDYKVEVKNINSFKFMEKAIEYEIERQKKLLEKGEKPRQETRGWDERTSETSPQRYKETAADYRYFPEPDIPPISLNGADVEKIRTLLPKLPDDYENEFLKQGLRRDYVEVVVNDLELAKYTQKLIELAKKAKVDINEVVGELINNKINIEKVSPKKLIANIISSKAGVVSGQDELRNIAKRAIDESESAVTDYKGGKENAIQAIVGKAMKISSGKADPKVTLEIIKELLD